MTKLIEDCNINDKIKVSRITYVLKILNPDTKRATLYNDILKSTVDIYYGTEVEVLK